jgi:hypothetical protein
MSLYGIYMLERQQLSSVRTSSRNLSREDALIAKRLKRERQRVEQQSLGRLASGGSCRTVFSELQQLTGLRMERMDSEIDDR